MKFLTTELMVRSPLYILIGLAFLPGRYDWSFTNRSASSEGLVCSAFFFCILIPVLSQVLSRNGVRRIGRQIVLSVSTIFLCFPYRWLGIDRWSESNGPDWFNLSEMTPSPELVWFPKALTYGPVIPHEPLTFFLLVALLVCVGSVYIWTRSRHQKPIAKSTIILLSAAILLIIVETWLHLSLRSPYTYIPHFERPISAAYWYHVALFHDGQGLVNADYPVFRALEHIFWGSAGQFNGMLIRRPFPYYLSSQLGYLVNPYYVTLYFNVAIWILTVLASYDYLAAHFERGQAAIATLCIASGPGFIMYVAQPQTYLWGYCAFMLIVWAHWRLCGDLHSGPREYLLFGVFFALALLTYDLLSLLFYLIGYEMLLKKKLKPILLACTVAITIYMAFGILTAPMAGFIHDDRNSRYIGISMQNIASLLIESPITFKNYITYATLLPGYVWSVSNSLFVFPVLAAIAGLFCLNSRSKFKLIGLLAAPSFLNIMFLHLGQGYMDTSHMGRLYLGSLPRFAFISYSAVYVLVGSIVWTLVRLARRKWGRGAIVIAICAIGCHVVLTNADVFGNPWLYYFFYYQSPTLAHF